MENTHRKWSAGKGKSVPITPPDEGWVSLYDGEILIHPSGRIRRVLTVEMLGGVNTYGYARVKIRGKSRYVHDLVASAFLGPRPKGKFVNHKDGVKTHNHFTNLEYVTPRENTMHAIRTGLRKIRPEGFRNPNGTAHKLTSQDALEIRQWIDEGERAVDVAAAYRVSEVMVRRIARGASWGKK